MRRAIVIPVHDSGPYLRVLLTVALRMADRVIVVDDGSRDDSWRGISEAAAGDPRLTAIRLDRNRGKAHALKQGFLAVRALLREGSLAPDDLVFTIDSDGQHALGDLPLLERAVAGGADLAVACRSFANYPFVRRMGNRLLSLYATLLSGIRWRDSESGMRCMRAWALDRILDYFIGIRYSDSQEIAVISARLGMRVDNTIASDAVYFRRGGAVYIHGVIIALCGALVLCRLALKGFPRARGPAAAAPEGALSPVIASCLDPRRVMFIHAPGKGYIREDRCQVPLKGMVAPSPRPPIELAAIAASLKGDYSCAIRDYAAEGGALDDLVRDLYRLRPRFLVVQFSYPTYFADMHACRAVKRCFPDMTVIGKGVCFLGRLEESLGDGSPLDWAVFGESEMLIPALVRDPAQDALPGTACRRNGRLMQDTRLRFAPDLDSLALPDRSLLRNDLYLRPETGEMQTVVHVQRGCPHGCAFCAVKQVSGERLRYRTVESVCREIEECVRVYGIKSFFLKADSFTADRQWVLSLCGVLRRRCPGISWVSNSRADMIDGELARAMREAGCRGIALGIESDSELTRSLVHKRLTNPQIASAVGTLRASGLQVLAMFIIGWPWDDSRSIGSTVRFAKELNATVTEFNFLVALPGTDMYEFCRTRRLIPDDDWVYRHDFASGAMRTLHLSGRQLGWLRLKAYLSFYLRLRYLRDNVLPWVSTFKGRGRLLRFAAGRIASLLAP